MNCIVGHSNMDLDCLGSVVLARVLYPDHRCVASNLVHPAARGLLNMYRDHLDLLPVSELDGRTAERLVVVDTRSRDRVRE